jgi:hypothetical protein
MNSALEGPGNVNRDQRCSGESSGAPLRGRHPEPAPETAGEHAGLREPQQFTDIREPVPRLLKVADGQCRPDLVKLLLEAGLFRRQLALQGAQAVAHALRYRTGRTVTGRQQAVDHPPHLFQKIALKTGSQVALQSLGNGSNGAADRPIEHFPLEHQATEIAAKSHRATKITAIVARFCGLRSAEEGRARRPVLSAHHPGHRTQQGYRVIPELIIPGGAVNRAVYGEEGQVSLLPHVESHCLHTVVQVATEHLQALPDCVGLHHQDAQRPKYGHVLAFSQLQGELFASTTLGCDLQKPDMFVERYQQRGLLDLLQAQPRILENFPKGATQVSDQRGKFGQIR